MTVDRLNIVAHDKFQKIIDEANKPGSAIHLQQMILGSDQLREKTVTVVSQPQLAVKLGFQPEHTTTSTLVPPTSTPLAFTTPEDQKMRKMTYDVIRTLEGQPQRLPGVNHLQKSEMQAQIVQVVTNQYRPTQM